ncbi:hypothetical protein [Natrialba asiatica]|uniref:Uncharacterized protein n=1 Tax=Natrialba asiatica (strain ATCC 700177 / DSM 12278 / JCM 9576 / FERM P-10747 / NBRC 102637 / 172P1) TaxID=29540 RepID=M0AT57_NATA1|nr:hypothetical protein [Natrialba asiatica]ELZ00549.1 hypothetical protein C481_12934 [Natrialba asiatica DSM 12278]
MPIQTYRLEVRETDASGIDADVYDAEDMIVASTQVAYEDYGLEAPASRDGSPSAVAEFSTDVTTIDLQFERDDAGFVFRVFGDREEVATVRADDVEWEVD